MKAGLDLEIAMFHCLVSAEEERLGLTPGWGRGGRVEGEEEGGLNTAIPKLFFCCPEQL